LSRLWSCRCVSRKISSKPDDGIRRPIEQRFATAARPATALPTMSHPRVLARKTVRRYSGTMPDESLLDCWSRPP